MPSTPSRPKPPAPAGRASVARLWAGPFRSAVFLGIFPVPPPAQLEPES